MAENQALQRSTLQPWYILFTAKTKLYSCCTDVSLSSEVKTVFGGKGCNYFVYKSFVSYPDAMSKINWKEIVQEIFRLPFKLKRQPFKVTFA